MPPPDETHQGVEIVVDILVVVGGVAVERGSDRHLKNSYNACKISWGSQAKMVSKCNRIASLVIFNYKIFVGEVPQTPLVLPPSCRQYWENTNAVQWPYHFLKVDDGPDVTEICRRLMSASLIKLTFFYTKIVMPVPAICLYMLQMRNVRPWTCIRSNLVELNALNFASALIALILRSSSERSGETVWMPHL